MNNLQFTKHATTRSQQRGIDQEAVSIIMKYGHCSHVGGDTKSWSMSKQEKRYARGDLGKAFTKIEKKLGYLIVKNSNLITVAHPYKKIKKNKRRFVR
tara:strand:+ start:351 stop:644 length:294 start_codon:yes stop_codon:yes gene_type:complete